MREYPLTYGEFKEGMKEGKLLGLWCNDCAQALIPPGAVCTSCGRSNLEVRSFAKKGKIRTFTVVRVGPAGFPAPYIVGLVELDDGPWVVGNVIGINPEEATMDIIGRDVSVGCEVLPFESQEGGVEGMALTFDLA
jgi:uncharacterized OB-fold protein